MNLNHITQFSPVFILGEGMTPAGYVILGILGAVILYLFIGGLKAKPIESETRKVPQPEETPRPRLMRRLRKKQDEFSRFLMCLWVKMPKLNRTREFEFFKRLTPRLSLRAISATRPKVQS